MLLHYPLTNYFGIDAVTDGKAGDSRTGLQALL